VKKKSINTWEKWKQRDHKKEEKKGQLRRGKGRKVYMCFDQRKGLRPRAKISKKKKLTDEKEWGRRAKTVLTKEEKRTAARGSHEREKVQFKASLIRPKG